MSTSIYQLFLVPISCRVFNMRTRTGTLKQNTAMERVLQSSYLYERSSQIHYVQEQQWANTVSLLGEDSRQMN